MATNQKVFVRKSVSADFKVLNKKHYLSIFTKQKQLLLRFIFCWMSFFAMTHLSYSQLNGNYTIGTGGDYVTFNDAVTSLSTSGVSGAVVFNVQSGIYTEQVVLNAITGASETNTITFQSQSGNAEDAELRFNSGSGANYTVNLIGASHVRFKNIKLTSLNSGNSRILTGTGTINDLMVENVVFTALTTSTTADSKAPIFFNLDSSSNIQFLENEIFGGSNGLILIGSNNNDNLSEGIKIKRNIFRNNSNGGIQVTRGNSIEIESNDILINSSSTISIALSVNASSGALRIVGNKLLGGRRHGLVIDSFTSDSDNYGLISNNFITSSNPNLPTADLKSINYLKVYNNSIRNLSSGIGLSLESLFGAGGNSIINNLIQTNSGLALSLNGLFGIESLDYNGYFNTGTKLVRISSSFPFTEYTTLNSWQSASGAFEQNSRFGNPFFVSDTDLRPTSTLFESSGTSLSEVVTDINDEVRSATPSIGAVEYIGIPIDPLAGTYTVDFNGSGDRNFTSVVEAAEALNFNGISAPVIFQLATRTYSEQIELANIEGSSAVNTITFESASGNNTDVIISSTPSGFKNFVWSLNSTSHLRIRNLTISVGGTSATLGRGLVGSGAINDFLAENVRFLGGNTSGTNTNRSNVYFALENSEIIKFSNCLFNGGYTGLLIGGADIDNLISNVEIIGNTVRNTNSAGFSLSRLVGAIIENNDVLITTTTANARGITMSFSQGATKIFSNKFIGGTGGSASFQIFTGTNENKGLIANNFFSSDAAISVDLGNLTHINFYHNSILNSGVGLGIQSAGGMEGIEGLRVINNLIKTGAGAAIRILNSEPIDAWDYNGYFNTGSALGILVNTEIASLEEWQTASGFDTNTLIFDSQFVSTTDLHATAPAYATSGLALPEVDEDIDGEVRNSLNPSRGADEYTAPPVIPMSGEYTINSEITDERNFESFSNAVNALISNSIVGTVVFKVANGTYNEQIVIPAIVGASNANSIRFESQSGNPNDVILQWLATNTATNYVVRFDNAKHIYFRDMTITSSSVSSLARVLEAFNTISDLSFENCQIIGNTVTGSSNSRAVVYFNPVSANDIRFINNTIQGGSHGIYFRLNDVFTPLTNLRIEDNEIMSWLVEGINVSPIYGGVIKRNTIHSFSTNSSRKAVTINSINNGLVFEGNRIFGATSEFTNGISNSAETPVLITNNFFTNTNTSTTLLISNTSHFQIYHNNVFGTVTTGSALQYAGGSSSVGNKIKNNIFKSSTGYAIRVNNAVGLEEINHNGYFTSGANLARWLSTDAADLDAWYTLTGNIDFNSLNVDPLFTSDETPYTNETAYENAGVFLPEVPLDIDGVTRNQPPSIGANEVNAVDLCADVVCAPGNECLLGTCIPLTYLLEGFVRDSDTSQPLLGVLVSSSSQLNPEEEIMTDENGFYSITIFYEGIITYTLEGYEVFTSDPILEATSDLDVMLEPSEDLCADISCPPGSSCFEGACFLNSYSVTGTVRDAETNEPLSGVLVTATGAVLDESTTDDNGFYTISVSYEGVIKFTKSGYEVFTSDPILEATSGLDVLLQASDDLCAAVTCDPGYVCNLGTCFAEIYSVTGTVRDAETNEPLSGVLVSSAGLTLFESTTDENGFYTISAYYEGVIIFTKAGYEGFASAPILEENNELDILLQPTDDLCSTITCPPGSSCFEGGCFLDFYPVTGTVRDAETNAVLSGVLVGSTSQSNIGEEILTDENGNYSIAVSYEGVIKFTKSGYVSFSSAPILEATSGLDVLLSLDALCEGVTCPPGFTCYQGGCYDSINIYVVSGIIRSSVDNAVISDAKVIRIPEQEEDVPVFTDANGFYSIAVNENNQIRVEKELFDDFTSSPILQDDDNYNITLIRNCEGHFCPIGQSCFQGECYLNCSLDQDCPPGTKCSNFLCVPLEEIFVSGIVRDIDTNEPLSNIRVLGTTLELDQFETFTDATGYYEITLLEGSSISFSDSDYEDFTLGPIELGQTDFDVYLQFNPCDGTFCPIGQSCVNGECKQACSLDSDCPEGTFCVGGNCLTLEELCWNTVCPEGTVCLNGRCIPENDPCVGATCPDGTYCLDGDCIVVPNTAITISGVVKDKITGANLSGVTIDAGYKTITTNTNGSYSITIPFGFNLDFSRWDYLEFNSPPMVVSRSNYNVELYKNWCLVHDCQPGQVCVNGRCETIFYTVSGTVSDELSSDPIANVTVKTGGAEVLTDETGTYTIQVILDNAIQFIKEGFDTFQSPIITSDNSNYDIFLGPNPCEGITCEPGFTCENGECVPDLCAGIVCQPGEICFNGSCFPQPDLTIYGTVKDINSGEPIAAAAVVNSSPTLVDYNGYFIVTVPYGEQILFIAEGYQWEYSPFLTQDFAVLEIFMTPDDDCENITCPDDKICNNGVCVDPCELINCPPGFICNQGSCFPVICDNSLSALQVSPEIGTSETEYTFTITYTDLLNANLAVGYPRLELDGNDNGSVEDPGDLTFAMSEIDPSDLDLTDGKIYQVTVSGLKDNTAWKARVVTKNEFNCQLSTDFINEPNVSVSNLDVAIFANNINFTNDNPNINETITIFARVRNISDFPAENFVVSAYDGENQIYSTVVDNLQPNSNIDLSWVYSFSEAGFYPIKIVIDETDVLEEINELNNFAIRPVIVGDYVLPGGIQATAVPNTTTVYVGDWITISGYASYFGIDESINPDASGANISFSYENGTFQVTSNSNGTYTRSLNMPSIPGIYTFTGSVTDYTLIGEIPSFQVEVIPQPDKADLKATISLDQTEIMAGEEITGTVTVSNIGELTATNFIFRYSSCEGIIGETAINSMAPGETLSFNFAVVISTEIGSCFNENNCSFVAIADVFNQVDDKSRNNNTAGKSLTVYPTIPDLTPNLSSVGFSSTMEEPLNFTVVVDNIGATITNEDFVVNVYVDDELLDTRSFDNLERCQKITYPLSVTFVTQEDHEIRIKVDEPLGSGSIEEYDEDNNEFVRIVRFIPPPVPLPNLYIIKNYLSVDPVLPAEGENFLIKAKVRNTGQAAIEEDIDVNFQIVEDGVVRNEVVTIPNGLADGAEIILEYETSLTTYGNHSVLVELDPLDLIEETTVFDNKASMPLCLDFEAGQFGSVWNGNFFVDTGQSLTGRVRNLGLFTATNVRVDFLLNGSEIGSAIIPELGPSYGSIGQLISIPYTFRDVGDFQLEMVVDRNEIYTECNEANNSFSKTITVRDLQPDLRILSEYIAPTSLNPDLDEPINLFISYENIGSNTTSSFKIRVTVDDVPLGEDILVDGLGAGQLATVPIETAYSSSTAGVKVVRGFVDVNQEADDLNYANNDASRAIVVGAAPNLFFTHIDFSTYCPEVGELVEISVAIENEGDIAADAEVHFFYVTENITVPIDVAPIFVDLQSSISTSITWTVINPEYTILAEIRNSLPQEFDVLDNFISAAFVDSIPPTLITQNITVYLDDSGMVEITPDQLDNGSFDDCGIAEIFLSQTSFDCSETGEQTILFTVRDFSGNESSEEVTVNVLDNIPPVIIETPEDILVENDATICGAIIEWDTPMSIDNCEGHTIEQISGLTSGSVFPVGSMEISYRATDANGNQTQVSFTVTIEDTEAPFLIIPDNITVNKDEASCEPIEIDLGQASATDNCSNVTISNDAPEFFQIGQTEVTWTAIDASGNNTELIQLVSITADGDGSPLDTSITQVSGALIANQVGATYQWYQCPNTLLSDETNQSFTPSENGDYKVEIILGDCTVESDCVTVEGLSIDDVGNTKPFSMYPNPANDLLYITTDSEGSFTIINQIGQIVQTFKVRSNIVNVINIKNLADGVYFVKGKNELSNRFKKLIIKH